MLLVLWTLIACTIYIGGILNLCIKDVNWLSLILMHDLEFHICDNLNYCNVNDDKFPGLSDCVVSHFHVIATM